jgi:hypothetical protein
MDLSVIGEHLDVGQCQSRHRPPSRTINQSSRANNPEHPRSGARVPVIPVKMVPLGTGGDSSEAVRFSCGDSGFVVEALDGTLGEEAAGGEPGEQLAPMPTECEGELLDTTQARAPPVAKCAIAPRARPRILRKNHFFTSDRVSATLRRFLVCRLCTARCRLTWSSVEDYVQSGSEEHCLHTGAPKNLR